MTLARAKFPRSLLRLSLTCSPLTRRSSPAGMDSIYELTNGPTQYEVRFDLGFGSERAYAVYDSFKIAPAKQKFKLSIGTYSGTAGGHHLLSFRSETII